MLRREVYERIGPFDEVLVNSEDYEWGRRAWRAGFQLGFVKESVAYTDPRATLRGFLEREYRVGYGCGQCGVRHGEEEQLTFHRPGRYKPPLSLLGAGAAERLPGVGAARRFGLFWAYWASYFLREAGNFRGWWDTRSERDQGSR